MGIESPNKEHWYPERPPNPIVRLSELIPGADTHDLRTAEIVRVLDPKGAYVSYSSFLEPEGLTVVKLPKEEIEQPILDRMLRVWQKPENGKKSVVREKK